MTYPFNSSKSIPHVMEGQVIATDDPNQMGRVKVWIPALDGENINADKIPWATYASPFFGFTVSYPAGGGASQNKSEVGYGFWAIPKIGATVLVFCVNADPTYRCYFASTLRLHRNRSMPAGRNTDFNGKQGPFGDAGDGNGNLDAVQPAYNNLREQFQNKVSSPQAATRGAFERQIAQAKYEKDGAEGYSANAADPSYLDPQTVCLVTPGRHAIIFQDDPKFSRLRLKTAEGHQVIFDDANERIYISTAKGKTWVELDQDGHAHIFAAESLSIRSGENLNFYADKDFNLEANGSVNIKANTGDVKIDSGEAIHLKAVGDIFQSACGVFDVSSESTIHLTSSVNLEMKASGSAALTSAGGIDFLAGGNMTNEAAEIHLNGPSARQAEEASCATAAAAPTIVPGHEPWTRPAAATKRGPNWKE